MINKAFQISLLGLALAFSTACQKDTEFSYIKDPPKPVVQVNKTYQFTKVKDGLKSPSVDILWIVDNSGSMGSHQTNLKNNLSRFMNQFTANSIIDWKMGLISTDVSDVPYLGFGTYSFDKNTPDPILTFNQAVSRLGTNGDYIERMFEPTLQHLQNYPNFLRTDAYFAMIVITDANEQSSISADTFYQNILALKGGDPSKVLAYTVLSSLDMGLRCSNSESAYYRGNSFERLNKLTNGQYYDLCDSNFAQTLTTIGQNLVAKLPVLSSQIALDEKPITSTIVVTYKGQVLKPGLKSSGGQWVYDPIYNIISIVDPAVIDGNIQDVQVSFTIDNTPK